MKGWRTIAFNAAVVVGGVVAYLDASDLSALDRFLPDGSGPLLAIALGVANVALRYVTTTPVGRR